MFITKWISENPVLFTAVVWPVISGIVVSLFKPRTPEEYAKMHPRWAGFLIFLSGFGVDSARAAEGLRRTLTGASLTVSEERAKSLPPPPEDTKP